MSAPARSTTLALVAVVSVLAVAPPALAAPAQAARATRCPSSFAAVDSEPLVTSAGRTVGTITLAVKNPTSTPRYCGQVVLRSAVAKKANHVGLTLEIRDSKGNDVGTGESVTADHQVPILALLSTNFAPGARVRFVVALHGSVGARAVAKALVPIVS